MAEEEGIVQPVKGKSSPDLGSWVVMAATRTDLTDLCRMLGREPTDGRRLYNSRLLLKAEEPALIGPMVGAPYAVMVLETLIAWGARQFVFVGWCGTISPEISVGDLLLPDAALIDEGTSRHYLSEVQTGGDRSRPSAAMQDAIAGALKQVGAAAKKGTLWSTDAVFRETPSKVLRFGGLGAVAVEMEASALFTVGRFRGVEVGAVLVVSDDLSAATWRHGFRDPEFVQGRQTLCKGVAALCRTM